MFQGVRENLGKEVNDRFSQVQPVFSTDGATLFFSQGSGINQQLEIWKTISDSTGLITGKQRIRAVNPNINQPKYVLESLSSHQYLLSGAYQLYRNQLLYTRGISVFDEKKTGADFIPDAFEKRSSPVLDSLFKRNNFFPFFHSFFNIYLWSKPEGKQSDIYILINESARQRGRLVKLPAPVNTIYNELTPWLDDEGRFLYFASNRPGGLGESDIYMCERLDGSFENWSVPKNLGPAVNSSKADYNFMIDPYSSYAYFVSEKNTFGSSDLFRIRLAKSDSLVSFSPLLLPGDRPDTSLLLNPGVHLPNNIVFLLDISHSMAESRKMVLLKKSMYRLVAQLRASDKVSLVVFGSGVETLLSGEPAKNKASIFDVISRLSANGGATNISAGLDRAYGQAKIHFIPRANNELFIVTDAVFQLKPKDEQLLLNSKDILLTGVVVGNDPALSAAFAPLVARVNGQLILIRNETSDLNIILKNVRMNAAAKN